jgi:biotin carboxyl carrier protein
VTRRYHVEVDGQPNEPAAGWRLIWLERAAGIARLERGDIAVTVLVEGGGSDWFVTIAGRRVPVAVRTRREQLLAEAETATRGRGGPVDVRASLPGLVVGVSAAAGSDVAEGDPLLTIEAMKMQNEVRAPRAGRIAVVAVVAGEKVATGALLLRIE